MNHKNDLGSWPTVITHKIDPRVWPKRISHEFGHEEVPAGITHKFYPWVWTTRITHDFDWRELPIRPMWFSSLSNSLKNIIVLETRAALTHVENYLKIAWR